jgi:hypothetical protein
LLLSMISVVAERLIVLYNIQPWESWKRSFKICKRNFFPLFIMGLLNSVLGCAAGCLAMIVIIIVFIVPAAVMGILIALGVSVSWLGLFILFILFVYIMHLINAILTVFKYSNWNLLFKEIVKEENL